MTVLIHPSSISKIMTEPKDKKETLSVGAKTYLKSIARELIYGFKQEVNTKGMRKGIECEDDSILRIKTTGLILKPVGALQHFHVWQKTHTIKIMNGRCERTCIFITSSDGQLLFAW